jgi:hypothetical protein
VNLLHEMSYQYTAMEVISTLRWRLSVHCDGDYQYTAMEVISTLRWRLSVHCDGVTKCSTFGD